MDTIHPKELTLIFKCCRDALGSLCVCRDLGHCNLCVYIYIFYLRDAVCIREQAPGSPDMKTNAFFPLYCSQKGGESFYSWAACSIADDVQPNASAKHSLG